MSDEVAVENPTDQEAKSELELLFEAGQLWNADLQAIKDSEINRWRFIALIMGGFALIAIIAIMLLMPLKEEKLVVLEHDRTTGLVEVMNQPDINYLTEDKLVTEYNINKFVLAYEKYNFHDHDDRYEIVAAMSSKAVYDEYNKANTKRNPQSFYNTLKDDARFDVDIKSISEAPETPGTYLVRFDKTLIFTKSAAKKPQKVSYIGTFAVRYVKPKVEEDKESNDSKRKDKRPRKQRLLNPLGFQVYSRQISKESV